MLWPVLKKWNSNETIPVFGYLECVNTKGQGGGVNPPNKVAIPFQLGLLDCYQALYLF